MLAAPSAKDVEGVYPDVAQDKDRSDGRGDDRRKPAPVADDAQDAEDQSGRNQDDDKQSSKDRQRVVSPGAKQGPAREDQARSTETLYCP